MELNAVKIVADSSADLIEISGFPFEVASLRIATSEKEYVDDASLDVGGMVEDLARYKGKSSTSCPNVNDWLAAFGEAQFIFCVTITGTLSGSFGAARVAARTYEEKHPDRRVFVLNSLSTGPECALFVDKIKELVLAGKDFDEVCDTVNAYTQKTGLIFMLESMQNLANNGRVSPLVAKMAGFLGIRVVGKASDKGDLEPLHKCRGEHRALETILAHMKGEGLANGRVRIGHCQNLAAAEKLAAMLKAELPQVKVEIGACRGLCSFYAERGGLLVGFEKM